MGYEIEFLPVGDASRAGDAIAVRYGAPGSYQIIVVDGGTDESGTALVDHIRSTYGADSVVSDVISTHPDADHSSGLRNVLRELSVARLWVHGVWHHAEAIVDLFESPSWTAQGLSNAIKREYPIIAELLELAIDRGVAVYEPFAGERIGPFVVLSPAKDIYRHLVPQFRRTPAPNADLLRARRIWIDTAPPRSIVGTILERVSEKLVEWVPETWGFELLREGGIAGAENESSVVLYGDFGAGTVLLTADAGINGLNWAANNALALGIDLQQTRFVQVPHHGSRRNVAPSVLDRILGPRQPVGTPPSKTAVVSTPKDDSNHPRKMVLNAFLRRGVGVGATQGKRVRLHNQMPARLDESQLELFGFFDTVENYD